MNQISEEFHLLSGGSDLVSGYRVEIPSAWRNTECTMEIKTSEGRVSSEEIIISGSHPVFSSETYSEQFGGCNVQGLKTYIPFSVLTETPDIQEKNLNQTLLELTRWRYGIFSEVGYSTDPMYPENRTLGFGELRNAGCTAEELINGGGLCPISSYDSAAETKQNLLCAENPGRQTILNQFLGNEPVKFSRSQIEYVVPSDTERVILLIEQSQGMANLWSAILSSTFQFINALPEGSELAIITYGAEATIHLQATRVVGGNREGLHYRIPRRVAPDSGDSEPCIFCGFSAAGDLATNTSTIIILSSSVTDKNHTQLMKFEQSANPIIRRIVFGKFSRQSLDSRRPVYMINENENILNITSDVSLALASLSDSYPSKKFHMESLETLDTEGSFVVEPSLSSDLWLQILLDDTTDINVFEIKSPSGQIFSFPKFDAGLVYFSLRGPRETGVWSYRIKFYASAARDRRMILECWGSGGSGEISLRSWTRMTDEPHQPVYIYAKLDQLGLPVLNAQIFAVISKPGDAITKVELLDNGLGYPDIVSGDGIYSGYFSQFSDVPGVYSVYVEAVNNATAGVINVKKVDQLSLEARGSNFPTQPQIPLESFRRYSTSPSFYLNSTSEFFVSSGLVQKRDSLPPSRITDFKLANYFNNSLFVTLAWSAPGNDFNAGQAFRYEIRCFTGRQALSQENFAEQGILVHSSLVPSPDVQGVEQRCTVGVPWPEEVFYYAIVAFDSAGNRGEVSNIISVYVKEPVTTTTEDSTTKFLSMKDVSKTLPLKSFIHSESMMYIIAGVISFILIIIVIILTIIIRRLGVCGRKINTDQNSEDNSSLPDLCHDQSYMRNSISYMSGYDLPEMLEYALRSPQKASAQEITNNNARFCDQYHVKISSKTPNQEDLRYFHQKIQSQNSQNSPSISPVNSTFTVGQSTDCSVSVSGSDHEMVGDTLQVVTPSYQDVREKFLRPEPKPRKVPPAVPNKTVHASLV